MPKPLYSVGTVVYHTSKAKYGRVVDAFPSYYEGKRLVHFYYVQHSGYTWSIPEEYLAKSKTTNSVPRKRRKSVISIERDTPDLV